MFNFLISLLTFALGVSAFLNHPNHAPVIPAEVIGQIEEHIASIEAPQGNPKELFQNGQENTPENAPTGAPQADEEADQPENSQADVQAADPDTTKVAAYNTSSDKVITSVAAVAVENAPPLFPQPEEELPVIEPTPTPTPEIEPTEPPEPPKPVPPIDPCDRSGNPRLMMPCVIPL